MKGDLRMTTQRALNGKRQLARRGRFRRGDLELTALATPTLIWYLAFAYLPMFGILIAFKKFTFFAGHGFIYNLVHSPWASGLSNFNYLFRTNDAFVILRNTVCYNIVFITLGVLIPTALAVAIGQMHSKRLAKATQTAMFLPYFMSWVVVTYFVGAFLQYDKGLVNSLLSSLGQKRVQWYMEKKYWPYLLVVINTWKTMGYSMVLYLATITSMDHSLFEAAMIDGATKWQQIRFITLPLLRGTMIMMFILNVGRIFYSDFGLFYQVPKASASLYSVTETLDVYVYRALGGSADISRPSAAGFIQSVAGCLMVLGSNWLVRKLDPDSAII